MWAFSLGLNDFACFFDGLAMVCYVVFSCVREYIEVRAKPALFFIIPATSGMLSKHLDSLSSLRGACLADLKQYSG